MATMRAKFWVNNVVSAGGSEQLSLTAVYGNSPENEVWSKATPIGSITMHITNPGATGLFKPGDEVYVDFTLIPKPSDDKMADDASGSTQPFTE